MMRILGFVLVLIVTGPSLGLSQNQPPTQEGRQTGNGVSVRNGDGDERQTGPTNRRNDVAYLRNGRVEYIAIGPPSQSTAAITALGNAGAQLVRSRDLVALNQRILIFDFGRLNLAQGRAILAQAAPQTSLDLHAIYRLNQGKPRLYAAKMLGVAAPGGCRLPNMRIGLIDGPVNTDHPALANARIVTQSVLARGDGTTKPDHGTAVAALMVGQDPGGALSGYAAGAQLYAVSAFGKERRGAGADVERISTGLDWLVGNRVRLINMSFAGPPNTALDRVLANAAARGALMIAAAGNDGKSLAAYPAAANPVIAVTAVDAAGRRYRAANTGAHIEFAAPGVDLYVAKRRGGAYASGTSYAAPIITAMAARLMARGVGSASALRTALRRQSTDLGSPGRDASFGWGLVRAPGC